MIPRLSACLLVIVSASHAWAEAPAPHWIAAAPDTVAPGYFRATLTLPQDVELDFADLFIAAEAHAIAQVNGQRVGEVRGVERFAHFAVNKQLRAGENTIAVQVAPGKKDHALLLMLHVADRQGKTYRLISDASWRASATEAEGWQRDDFDASAWKVVADLGPIGTAPWGAPTTEVEHYHQWKLASGAETAVDPRTISVPDGFAVELLRSAGKDEGSWISLAFDDRGRLVVGREDKGLLRMTLPKMPLHALAGEAAAKAITTETINDTLLECRGLLFVGQDLYANANNSKGLYRLRDTNGDDTFDEVKLLREMPGDVGHGRNDLTLGPDGKLYLILGNDVRYPAEGQPGTSPFRNFAQDRLLPCEWNKNLFNAGTPAPGGYVVRTDLEAKSWEVVAGGFRNAYGIAFNADGEMFTYDADMEWDAGAPWYRPTRINHIVSGGDYGWRQGTDKWRAWYPDSLPSTLDVGLGSPTTVKFVPDRFSHHLSGTLLALDWAYGRILMLGMEREGASYKVRDVFGGSFISGRPLNVCDVEFGPDGALYFVTGGRRTQSGIYRVVELPTAPPCASGPPNRAAIAAHELRRQLERFHGREDAKAIDVAWPHLASDDSWLRNAARVAVEAQPLEQWRQRAMLEQDPSRAAYALLALARLTPDGEQRDVLTRLGAIPFEKLSATQGISLLRAYQLSLIRDKSSVDKLSLTRQRLEALFPAKTVEQNDLLCELLVDLQSPTVVERTLPLLDAAATPEEKLHYLMCLRLVKAPWTIEQRRAYFVWLQRAEKFPGAHYMPRFIAFIRQDAVATLSDEEKKALGPALEAAPTATAVAAPPRPFVKAWTMADFASENFRTGDAARGKELFIAAQCAQCHRMNGEGALVGPDLTGVGKRFSKRDLLLSLIEPSRVIDDKYKQKTIITTAGVSLTGQVALDNVAGISLITDPTQPTKMTLVPRATIEEVLPSTVSPMPAGTINVLTKEEILSLLEYLVQ
jgi:putative heme-binding domain-containing protein